MSMFQELRELDVVCHISHGNGHEGVLWQTRGGHVHRNHRHSLQEDRCMIFEDQELGNLLPRLCITIEHGTYVRPKYNMVIHQTFHSSH